MIKKNIKIQKENQFKIEMTTLPNPMKMLENQQSENENFS